MKEGEGYSDSMKERQFRGQFREHNTNNAKLG